MHRYQLAQVHYVEDKDGNACVAKASFFHFISFFLVQAVPKKTAPVRTARCEESVWRGPRSSHLLVKGSVVRRTPFLKIFVQRSQWEAQVQLKQLLERFRESLLILLRAWKLTAFLCCHVCAVSPLIQRVAHGEMPC